jgi:lysozyme
MTSPIKILDTYKFYKGLPGQVKAAEYLESVLTSAELEKLAKLYRSNPAPTTLPSTVYLLCEKTDGYDEFGLRILRLSLMNGDRTIDKIAVCSGQSYAQEFINPRDDYSGSMRPAPEGVWDIGKIDDLGYDPGSSDGFGRYFVPIVQRNAPNNRSAFGLHEDRNRVTSPGSAGCLSPYTIADMQKIITWLKAAAKPQYLVVDWGIGYLKSIGFSYSKK